MIAIKLLESILCGRSARWVLSLLMGNFLSLLVVSVGQLYFIVCWLVLYFSARCKQDVCILALVSAIYSYTLETFALSPSLAFAQLDGNYSLSQKVNSSLGQSRNSQDLKTSRANFEGGLKEGSDDKGFVARYLAMFLTSLDEAVMESLAESREKMSAYESRAADSRTAALKRDASQANYATQVPQVRVLFRSCRHVF